MSLRKAQLPGFAVARMGMGMGTGHLCGTESPGAQGHQGVGRGHRIQLRAGHGQGLSHSGVFPAGVTPW